MGAPFEEVDRDASPGSWWDEVSDLLPSSGWRCSGAAAPLEPVTGAPSAGATPSRLAAARLERGGQGDVERAVLELDAAVAAARRLGCVVLAEECERFLLEAGDRHGR